MRIPAPQRVKRAQLYNAGRVEIAPARAEPSTNDKSQPRKARFTLIILLCAQGGFIPPLSATTFAAKQARRSELPRFSKSRAKTYRGKRGRASQITANRSRPKARFALIILLCAQGGFIPPISATTFAAKQARRCELPRFSKPWAKTYRGKRGRASQITANRRHGLPRFALTFLR